MSRQARAFLATLMICLIVLPVAATAGWRSKEIGWHVTYTGGFSGTAIVQRDTAFTTLNGANTLDTTAVFSIDDADVLPRGYVGPVATDVVGATGAAAVQNDTTMTGFLVVQIDSAAAAVTNGTITVMIDGRMGGMGATTVNSSGWSRVDSTVTTIGAVADQSLQIPIRTLGKYASPLGFAQLRARTIGGTGVMSSVRCFLRYWKNNASGDVPR